MIKDYGDLMFDIIEKMDSMVRIIDENDQIIYMNKKMREEFGDFTGKLCYELLCREGKCDYCVCVNCKKSQQTETKDIQIEDRDFRILAFPVSIGEREKYAIEFFYDITAQKKLEQENMAHYKKLKEDLSFAKQVQNRVLPLDDTYWEAFSISSSYIPGEELSGDLFDVVKLDDSRSLIYIADVSGHGVRSSLLTIFLRQVIRGMKGEAANLTALMDELLRSYNELNLGSEQYLTILCGLFDRECMEMTFVNGGHNCPPLILKKDGSLSEVSISGLPICGLLKKSDHKTKTVSVDGGDQILLYTDGLTEAFDLQKREQFGIARLKNTVKAASSQNQNGKEIIAHIMEAVQTFTGEKAEDDMAVISVEIL